jgi:hypothetical protein
MMDRGAGGVIGRLVASTGAPAQWPLVLHLVAGLLVGGALGLVLRPHEGAILAAVTAALVAGAGSAGPLRVALKVAALAALAGPCSIAVAFATGGAPTTGQHQPITQPSQHADPVEVEADDGDGQGIVMSPPDRLRRLDWLTTSRVDT